MSQFIFLRISSSNMNKVTEDPNQKVQTTIKSPLLKVSLLSHQKGQIKINKITDQRASEIQSKRLIQIIFPEKETHLKLKNIIRFKSICTTPLRTLQLKNKNNF